MRQRLHRNTNSYCNMDTAYRHIHSHAIYKPDIYQDINTEFDCQRNQDLHTVLYGNFHAVVKLNADYDGYINKSGYGDIYGDDDGDPCPYKYFYTDIYGNQDIHSHRYSDIDGNTVVDHCAVDNSLTDRNPADTDGYVHACLDFYGRFDRKCHAVRDMDGHGNARSFIHGNGYCYSCPFRKRHIYFQCDAVSVCHAGIQRHGHSGEQRYHDRRRDRFKYANCNTDNNADRDAQYDTNIYTGQDCDKDIHCDANKDRHGHKYSPADHYIHANGIAGTGRCGRHKREHGLSKPGHGRTWYQFRRKNIGQSGMRGRKDIYNSVQESI